MVDVRDILLKVEEKPYSAFFYTPAFYKKKSFLFYNPVEIIETENPNDIEFLLKRVTEFINSGLVGYGIIPFETGYLFEKRLSKNYLKSESKLIQFYLFERTNKETIDYTEIDFSKIDNKIFAEQNISNFKLNTSKVLYTNNLKKIKNLIECGDTYQVNFCVKGKFNYSNASDLFLKMLFNQSAEYCAFINNGKRTVISFSPELFFQSTAKTIIAKPMKGTITRGINLHEDLLKNKKLRTSKKDYAENIMIVDMLRNDLGKVCIPGSIRTENIFRIQAYETLFQMTSTIHGKLKYRINFSDILKNIFPCGSVTGAPKIRTMEIIRNLEKEQRGIYTGTIGLIEKSKSVFNVAIRTVILNKKTKKGEIGLGSGIVADSDSEREYEEVLLKGGIPNESSAIFRIV